MTVDAAPAPVPRSGRWIVGAAIVLLALNLRSSVGSLSVLFDVVQDDLGMSATLGGLLATLPLVCFAAIGLTAGPPVRSLGVDRAAIVVLVAMAAGLLVRALTDNAVVFFAASTLALASSAVGNVILPPLTKRHFPDHIGLVGAIWAAAVAVGSGISSLVTVPVADAFGSWRAGLGMWTILALVTLLPWLPLLRRSPRDTTRTPHVFDLGTMARSPVAWAMAGAFGAQGLQAYAQIGWLPAIMIDAGVGRGEAAAMLALFGFVAIPLTLMLPWLIRRAGRRPWLPLGFGLLTAAGWTGVLLSPDRGSWAWITLLSFGGGAFTWNLTMIGLKARTQDGVAALSIFTQSVGYLLACAGPFGVGLLHDLTGSWSVPVAALAAAGLLISALGAIAMRPVLLEDTLDLAPPVAS